MYLSYHHLGPLSEPLTLGPILAALVLAAAFAAFRSWRRWRDIAGFKRHAARAHLDYRPRDDGLARLSTHWPMDTSPLCIGANVFHGTHRGRPLVFGELRYGPRLTSHHLVPFASNRAQLVAVGLGAPVPDLDVTVDNRPGLYLDQNRGIGYRALIPDFDEKYSMDPRVTEFAGRVLPSETVRWLLADVRARQCHLRFEGRWLWCLRPVRSHLPLVWSDVDLLHEFLGRAAPAR